MEAGVTQDELSERTGISVTSLSRMENGTRAVNLQQVEAIAKALEIEPTVFFQKPVKVRIAGYIGAGAEIEAEFEQIPEDGLDQIEIPFSLPAEMEAFEVKGDSMLPRFRAGDVIIVFKDQRRPTASFFGDEAAVQLADGRRFVKEIAKNGEGVMLFSTNARPIFDVEIVWVGEIFTIIPARQVRRAWIRDGK